MPNPPRFTLPPALFARVEALRAAAHPAAPSRQAVVEAALGRGLACLESGPDADEAMVPGMTREVVYGVGEVGPGGPSLKTILLGREPTPVEQALALVDALAAQVADLAWVRLGTGEPRRYQCQGCDAERLEWEPGRHVDGCEVERLLARAGGAAGARGGADGCEGVGRAGDAPRRQPGAPVGFGAFTPAPNDPRWATDAAGTYYACEAHTVGAMAPNGRRVTVAVAAGDTVAVVGRGLEAAWRASEGRGRVG